MNVTLKYFVADVHFNFQHILEVRIPWQYL